MLEPSRLILHRFRHLKITQKLVETDSGNYSLFSIKKRIQVSSYSRDQNKMIKFQSPCERSLLTMRFEATIGNLALGWSFSFNSVSFDCQSAILHTITCFYNTLEYKYNLQLITSKGYITTG